MDSPTISLQHIPHIDPQRHHYHHSVPPSSFQPHLPHQQPQSQFPYADYGFDDGRFYSQQQQHHAYHPYLTTPPSTTTATTEDSSNTSSGGGGTDSPFDDENQLPTPDEFRAIVDDYLNNLSPKKRDKALVDQHRYYLIQQVLRDPRNTAISTAQFRFWVKKMFQLQLGTMDIICHDNKPVAVKEQIYDILVRAHREAHHGGRDKTSALVRRKFSWIPKELVARFVRHCPFCITRRNGGQSPNTMKTDSPQYHYTPSSQSSRHFSFDHHAPPIICTPTTKEKNDLTSPSGPPSAENGYDTSPHYVTMPYTMSSSSPRRLSYLQYDRDEEEFLNSYPYDPNTSFQPQTSLASMMGFRSASSSTTTNTSSSQLNNNQSTTLNNLPSSQHQNNIITSNNTPTTTSSSSTTNSSNTTNPPPPLFYHQQNYIYPSYDNGNYYPNMLGITACDGGTNDTHRPHDHHPPTSIDPFSPPPSHQHPAHAVGVDLLDHHHQDDQPAYFNANNPLATYANPMSDSAATAAAAAVAFGASNI